ncbi:MAG: hypothetical protein HY319_30505 [Armatimonadetes bacterium]|nr:hypothetical protein [Armatimonadota bacterium]
MNPRRGFSQLEVLIAVGILALGILGVVGSLTYSTQAQRFGERTTEAVQVARELVEKIRVRNLPYEWDPPQPPEDSGLCDEPGARKPLSARPFASDFPGESPFQRNIRVTPLTTDRGDYRYGMTRIEVTIFWSEQGRERTVRFASIHRRP